MIESWLWVAFPTDWMALHRVRGSTDDRHGVVRILRYRIFDFILKEAPSCAALQEPSWLIDAMICASIEESRSAQRLGEEVVRLRSTGFTWEQIGGLLHTNKTAAHKRFGHRPMKRGPRVNLSEFSDENLIEQISPLVFAREIEWAAPVVLRDLVVQARCQGHPWSEISAALGVGESAGQKRFGQGLPPMRIRQLMVELSWAANVAYSPAARKCFRKRLEIAKKRGYGGY
ncbi:hypothetical protein [Actinomadura napierensis]|uniref:Sigma-70 family RNA polymerase sigma factor n=1 Tax=Actinomadura napierensis TaxID=267854 RepID=A0ABN3A9R7_9ACTN